MNRNFKAFLLLILSIVLAACTTSGNGVSTTPTLVPTPVMVEKPAYLVQRGEVVRTIQLNGRVTPVLQQELFFRSEGFVKEVLVKTGDEIAEGDVLARLDEPERYQVDITTAELAYAQAQLILEQAQLDVPIKLAEAQIAVEQARINLDKAKNAFERLKYPHVTDEATLKKYRADIEFAEQNLKDTQSRYDQLSELPDTDPERANALSNLIEARKAYYQAVAKLNWAESNGTPAEINLAQINLDLAQGMYDKAAAEVQRSQVDSQISDVSLAQLALKNAGARLKLALKAQEAIELRAPFGGQVLSLGITPGSSVKAFQAVLTLADPSELEIRAVPAAEDLNLLGIGQTALVRLSSRQGEEFLASITGLPLTVTGLSAPGGQDTSVHFSLDNESGSLSLGDAATLIVTVDSRQDVLWLPPAAIRTFQGESFVFVESNGVQRRVNITVGLKSAERVEILSGLEEGVKVIGQ